MKSQENSYSWKKFGSLISQKTVSKPLFSVAILLSVISTIVSLVVPLFAKNFIDGFMGKNFNTNLVFYLLLLFAAQVVLSGFALYLLNLIGLKLVFAIRNRLWKKILYLPIRYFDNTNSGEFVSRMINDTGLIKTLVSDQFPQVINGIISLVGTITILLFMDAKLTVILFIAIPVLILIVAPLGKKLFVISKGLQAETAAFSSKISQVVGNVRLVKATTSENVEVENGRNDLMKLFQFGNREAKINAIISPLTVFVVMGILIGIIIYGGVRVNAGTLTIGTLIAFLIYVFQLLPPITSFVTFFSQLQKVKGATQRIYEILNESSENLSHGDSVSFSDKHIYAKNLTFSYDDENTVIDDISFEGKPGEMIAFVGPSGAGKSTIFSLLERFYHPTDGNIFVGEHSMKHISLESWRSQFSYVLQDNLLLSGTIRENLIYGLKHEVTDEDLWQALKLAYADSFVADLPEQLDAEVGEHGVKLSGGQKQRITIARAFLSKAQILLLDEATASLDVRTEQYVQKSLLQLMKHKTIFVIAHRIDTIKHSNKIIFVDKGRITGQGTHDELIRTHELYASFIQTQFIDDDVNEERA
ncbi:putative ABC transporter ATP binding protein [Listeria fleischmannii 1991]|jgi:ATP-binding cassette subfamily B protein AbcA/BmrA|uniref:Multidrug resistance ABC transporter ATP-binding/permease protein BmrA n=3 Tax=Listeria fleischmannii TaxID=1069827 RepID=A0A2X3J5Y5_9LIST|nr:ABC transporter ATP-binding protein [Listeria fleischmannii]EMG28709.1 putative ABC transporter ATP binding protein [Listeria fleischmannii subsp. fleischmannii LU2006-1]EUJ52635.1 putative ABC transporter ATP binding protein [Listeria fleischmannii FSL S10-1203]KMT57707.1 putative ABC transporter ATP binding protein [Listeria fleischmannii 1991]SQC69550.1 Multidrug resistance ABC transporter ATP-binding/permease protein BmrA [Listeria fleischmannii subsp. fleischmannii]